MPSGLQDKAMDHAQSEPRPLPDRLCRKERLKSFRRHLGLHAAASVADDHGSIWTVSNLQSICFVPVKYFPRDFDGNDRCGGVPGVQDEIEERQLHLSWV